MMSRKERERLIVLNRVKERELSRRSAAEVLGMSLRQLHRTYLRYLAEGDAGLIHRGRGKAGNRKTDAVEREKAVALYRSTYRSFGPTLWAEKLGPGHGIWISHDTARRWLMSEGLLEKTRRGRRSRRRRMRKEKFGQMVQMDGSHHAWFAGRGEKCCLMVMVDDATGRMSGRFFAGETLFAAMEMFHAWCEQFGVPRSLYVDRAGIYRCDRDPTVEELLSKKPPLTQFGRAMKELDVRLILARSPQAKGRVERANGTLQDRLVKEMGLVGIDTIDRANRWLEQSGFFAALSAKFGVVAMDLTDAHRPVVSDLGQVLCIKAKRSVSNDGCVQWEGQSLQLEGCRAGLKSVEVWERSDGSLQFLDGGSRLKHEVWTEPVKVRRVVINNKRHKLLPHQHLRLPGSHARLQSSAAGVKICPSR